MTATDARSGVPIPEVYVLWHPQCPIGEPLARKIHGWLRPGNAVGPQVFYRSLPPPGGADGGLPLPLPGESRGSSAKRSSRLSSLTNMQIVLPLVDANMVADPAWRLWVARLKSDPPAMRVMFPVALDATAYGMPPPVRHLNYLRPTGLSSRLDEVLGPKLEIVSRSLLKQLTEAICGVLLPRARSAGAPSNEEDGAGVQKISVFLSHAKGDGVVPARRLRDYVYSQTQLKAFYDENDIAYGSVFSRLIGQGLNSSDTAALIAIRSALYASRPWCRRELSLFRRPQQQASLPSNAEHWSLYPAIVVEAMEGSQFSAGIPELGNSSVIRWRDDDESLEELIVTAVIRDAMLAAFHTALGASVPTAPGHIVINWLPDATTLLQIPSVQAQEERHVIYPGRGLSGLELDTLSDLFPRLTFQSFEEALA